MEKKLNIVLITQARVGSTRLPKKILKKIGNKTILEIHIERLKNSKTINKIIIATTNKTEDNIVEEFSKKTKVSCFRGSENDVLDRYYKCAVMANASHIVRVTSDCPLIDPFLVDELVKICVEKDLDYYSNNILELYPDGQDIEVVKFEALKKAWENAILKSDREHVTSFIKKDAQKKRGVFKSKNHYPQKNYNNVRLTIDEKEDFNVISKIVEFLGTDKRWIEYSEFYLENKDIHMINSKIQRNQGYLDSKLKD